eukprot:TRINITY_DN3185_c0_g1_i1.p1 TRINITY_DN3185_c0_g1~~TRINITY_DN3185_c0_g1_i1.p1  ORF type:complete len:448 (+),score=32.18 TRINITY_DN3185_c0_g1_i1:65-1408(+)
MGARESRLERVLGSGFPEGEKYFGLENFGNTCYCNSVLQSLYFCIPFRQQCIKYLQAYKDDSHRKREDEDHHLLLCLCDLFAQISNNKKRTGAIPPKKFVAKLRRENEVFRTWQHQDAHEFFNYLLNTIDDLLQKEMQQEEKEREKQRQPPNTARNPPTKTEAVEDNTNAPASARGSNTKELAGEVAASSSTGALPTATGSTELNTNAPSSSSPNQNENQKRKSFVHDLFEGILSSETRCLTCETVTSREESFLDLSIDIEQNVSVTNCLRNFSACETLNRDDKFFCDRCGSLQEAQKCIRIKKSPNVLAIHLKRFKFLEQQQRHKKLSYRVPFSFELRLPESGDGAELEDRLYSLFAVVIHVGSGPNMGHYVSMVRSQNHWLMFDDDIVSHIEERDVQLVFGVSHDTPGTTQTGYILLYSLNDCATKHVGPPSASTSSTGTAQYYV